MWMILFSSEVQIFSILYTFLDLCRPHLIQAVVEFLFGNTAIILHLSGSEGVVYCQLQELQSLPILPLNQWSSIYLAEPGLKSLTSLTHILIPLKKKEKL